MTLREKRCGKCGLVKERAAFSKNKKNHDGLHGDCKDCVSIYNRIYFQSHKTGKQTTEDNNTGLGIESWNQVEGIIRELAELQAGIETEYRTREQQLAFIKKYTEEVIEPAITHQMTLQRLLEEFLGKLPPQKKIICNVYRFGTLKYFRKKLSIELNSSFAEQMADKP